MEDMGEIVIYYNNNYRRAYNTGFQIKTNLYDW